MTKRPGRSLRCTPKFEVRSCADDSMPPHFTAAAAMAAAKTIGAYYQTH